jgi:hypothetical protein
MLALMSCAPPGSEIFPIKGMWICDAINGFVTAMKPEHQWLCILADDHECPPDMLLRLLAHDVPLVAPLCLLRTPPYHPSIFRVVEGGYQSYALAELHGHHGLFPSDTFGGPGMVIRREVLEAIGQPFFVNDPGHPTSPREDLYSVNRCRLAGYQPYTDLDLFIGHCFAGVMYPRCDDAGEYGVQFWAEDELIGSLYTPQLQQRFGPHHVTKGDLLYHAGVP